MEMQLKYIHRNNPNINNDNDLLLENSQNETCWTYAHAYQRDNYSRSKNILLKITMNTCFFSSYFYKQIFET